MVELVKRVEQALIINMANTNYTKSELEEATMKTCTQLEAIGMPIEMVTMTIKGILKSWGIELS